MERWRVPREALGTLAPQGGGNGPARPAQARRAPAPAPQSKRRGPIPPTDRQLLHFFVKFSEYGKSFLLARQQMHEKNTLCDLFDDTEVRNWVRTLQEDPVGIQRLNHAPESVIQGEVSQELRSVIMEGLLQEKIEGEATLLNGLLKRAVFKAWVRFSHELKAAMSEADSRQDIEKFKELSEQFLDLQRKLKEFEDSYVSGKTD